MATIKIEAVQRDSVGTGSAKVLRRTGKIPAVVYGHGGKTLSIAIDRTQIENAMRENAQTFDLAVDGSSDTVLLCDAQFDLSGECCTHADFKRVAADVLVEVDIEVKLRGDAIGLRAGGKLDHSGHSVKVRCLPNTIPDSVTGHVDGLDLGDVLRAAELEMPAGVELITDPEHAIASVHRPGGDAEAEEGEEGAASEPEVIGKGDADAAADASAGESGE
jgi:large subunit ribosomal protein L25